MSKRGKNWAAVAIFTQFSIFLQLKVELYKFAIKFGQVTFDSLSNDVVFCTHVAPTSANKFMFLIILNPVNSTEL